MFANQIMHIGNYFRGRLDDTYLNGALDYVNHNEEPLAIETLCEHLSEYEITITKNEYNDIILLIHKMGLSELDPPYSYLEELIK
ncbi:MafI family immunity protein [Orbus wheelerorum]|uniref:MafI family immunity protein n=1 Tax=Orbus wheelerorum TaxID=3074111 RepID=UPI00370D152E